MITATLLIILGLLYYWVQWWLWLWYCIDRDRGQTSAAFDTLCVVTTFLGVGPVVIGLHALTGVKLPKWRLKESKESYDFSIGMRPIPAPEGWMIKPEYRKCRRCALEFRVGFYSCPNNQHCGVCCQC